MQSRKVAPAPSGTRRPPACRCGRRWGVYRRPCRRRNGRAASSAVQRPLSQRMPPRSQPHSLPYALELFLRLERKTRPVGRIGAAGAAALAVEILIGGNGLAHGIRPITKRVARNAALRRKVTPPPRRALLSRSLRMHEHAVAGHQRYAVGRRLVHRKRCVRRSKGIGCWCTGLLKIEKGMPDWSR